MTISCKGGKMGKKDLSLKSYLSDPVRYADVYNGSVFGGMQVLEGAQLEEDGTVQTKSDSGVSLERICDLAMRQKNGGERIRPTGTLIIHWGNKPWDGPRSLHEFLDFDGFEGGAAEELKKLVPEYPLHILDLNAENDYSQFRTSLRTVFELYARRADKQQFRDYVETHEECRHLDVETYNVIGKLIGSSKLQQQEYKEENEEERDMSNAIDDFFEDGRIAGKAEGKAEGIIELGRDFGLSEKDILARLQQKLNVTAQRAREYLDAFEKQCV